ncbi:MAG: ThuA domain-containing protein [Ginsengibacter sp.]
MEFKIKWLQILIIFVFGSLASQAQQSKHWVTYKGFDGPGKGKNIVFVSGDEEYRSEEALPMLAQIMAKRYGFTCTVLFATDPKTAEIDPMNLSNINGLAHLATADLMVIFTRFRELPDSQMKYIDQYIQSGKPVVGLRTATHAFNYKKNKNSSYAKYDFRSRLKGWEDGFGRQILGETWVNHHGDHMHEGTRGLVNGIEQDKKNPILNGVKDIWTPSDVYTVRDLGNADVLIYGQCTNGMIPQSPVNLNKSIMPVAWTKLYTGSKGETGRVFTTTMGASIDLLNEDLRRLIVNGCFWAMGMEKQIPDKADVDFISEYKPTMFGFGLFKKGLFPSQFELKNK